MSEPTVDPQEPTPVQTDNGPRPEDGDQTDVSQDPNVSYETVDDEDDDDDDGGAQ